MLDVLIVVSSDPRYDTRSTKFLNSLLATGFKSRIVGISIDGSSEHTDQLVRLPTRARSGKKFFFDFYRNVIPEARRTQAKLVIAGDLFALPPALAAKNSGSRAGLSSRLIYDSKELYRELPSLKRRRSSFLFWDFIENRSIRKVDSVITVNQSISEALEARWHLPTTVVMNVPDSRPMRPETPRSLDKILLAFSGGLQPGRGLHNLVRLLTFLPEKYELRIIGDGNLRPELENQAKMLRLGNRIHFSGRVRSSEVVNELSKCHLGVYLMENTGLCHYLALPNKLFQFISAAIPVIVPNFPEMDRIVRTYSVGRTVDPANLDEAAKTIVEMTSRRETYDGFVANCVNASSELNWQVEKEKFLRVVSGLIK
ncbi:MAG TPA: glycosyltransferase [Candidatus Kryptonia bacterium]